MNLAWLLQLALSTQAASAGPTAFGVADPAQRFASVPAPAPPGAADPCPARGPVGRWVRISAENAPQSLHEMSWLDSAAVWSGTKLVVAQRRNGKWTGAAFDPCGNAWSPIAETSAPPRDAGAPWNSGGHDRPFQPAHVQGSYDGFDRLSVWDLARRSWKKMAATGAPSPRLEPTAVAWTGSRFLIWGGRVATTAPGSVRLLGDGALYDPAADRWTPMSAAGAPAPRTDATVVWTGRKLVVVGGNGGVGGPALAGGGVYDPATNRWTRLPAPPDGVTLPKANVGPLTRIMVAPYGRVVFLPDEARSITVLDADRAVWSTIGADELGKRTGFRALLAGRRLLVWGGLTVVAEHRCPPPVPGLPLCDPFAETAPHNDGWMIVLPEP